MKLLNKFLLLFIFEQDENLEIEEKNNSLISNLLNFFLFLIVFTEGIISIFQETPIFAIPLLLFSTFFGVNYLYLARKTQTQSYQKLLITFISLTLAFFVVYGGPTGLNIIWCILFPPIALSLFGKANGLVFSISLFAFILLDFLLLEKVLPYAFQYTTEMKFLSSGALIISFIIAYALNHAFNEIILKKERIMLNSQNINRSQEEMISRLSHQIRTPLSNITGIIAILEQTSLTNDQKDYINTIHASANNLVNVVNSMVDSSKPNLNQVPEGEVSFNLFSTLNNTIKLFSTDQTKRNFSLSISADIPNNLTGNSIKIKQIFLNLLNGIIKHISTDQKFVSIEVTRKQAMPGQVELYFKIKSNVSIPIASEKFKNDQSIYDQDIIHINTSKYIQLLDIGITQKLVETEKHSIIILPEQEKTSVEFGMTFKEGIKSQSILNIKEKKSPPTPIIKPSVEIKNANILLVEDNFSNQQIIMLYIKNEVNKIEVAFNGKEALDKFGKAKYDLILMDVQMPIMDGFKATQKIREIEKSTNSHTPIIAVTANAFPEDKEKCLSSGMDDYVSKPFQPEDLIKKIRKYLS